MMVNSSKDGILLQYRRWSRIELSFDGLTFVNVKVDVPICSPDLSVKRLSFSVIGSSFHTNIYKPLQTLSREVSNL